MLSFASGVLGVIPVAALVPLVAWSQLTRAEGSLLRGRGLFPVRLSFL